MTQTALNATQARFRTALEQRRIMEERSHIVKVATETAQYLNRVIDTIKMEKR